MNTRSSTLLQALGLLLATSACFSTMGIKHDGLGQVDALLSHVERLQVESAVARETAQRALESLRVLIAPEFKGDPALEHARYVAAVEASEDQAEALQDAVRPLRKTGERVFAEWTENLESFGNLSMRQRSQERLEETRRRFDAIIAAAVSAQLAFDGFNGDLTDHALFLEHDFNSTSVALIAQEFDGLKSRGKELAKRLDACGATCQTYIEFSAPSAQIAPEAVTPPPAAEKKAAAQPAPPPPPTPKKAVLKNKTATTPGG